MMLSHVLVQGTLTILQSVIVLVFVLGVFSVSLFFNNVDSSVIHMHDFGSF